MDTSKEYIEMCRKAVEIQELWEPSYFDYIFIPSYTRTLIDETERIHNRNYIFWEGTSAVLLNPSIFNTVKRNLIFWLPRQDQLQDISRPNRSKTAWAWNSEFTAFLNVFDIYDPIEKSNMSMEQLMLCFVMHEKYQKKWNGKDWQNNENN